MTFREELSIAEKDAIAQKIDDALARIRTRQDLADFANLLGDIHAKGAFEETMISNYLDGISGALHNLHGYCRNHGFADPKQPDWQWMGRILVLAFSNA